MGIELTENAKNLLAVRGFDPVLGARPLRRTVQKELDNRLSSMLLRGDVRAAVRRIGGLDEMDLGAAAPGIEISQMRHERQRARMFMS